MSNKNCFIGCESDYKNADFVLFGAPFDGTTSYRPGTRFASARIREESNGIETYSPYLDKDLSDVKVYDAGDLELPFGNTQKALRTIKAFVAKVAKSGKTPIMVGGEHLVTLPAYEAVSGHHGDIYVVQFDAHADLRDDYLGEKLSHATVIRRISERAGAKKIFQFGIRSGEKSEFEYAKANTNMTKFTVDGIDKAINIIGDGKVYLTVDLDVIDPSEFAATGTPEAGGIKFSELRDAIEKLGKLNIVGCDITELSPPYDASGVSTALACKFLRELILSISK